MGASSNNSGIINMHVNDAIIKEAGLAWSTCILRYSGFTCNINRQSHVYRFVVFKFRVRSSL